MENTIEIEDLADAASGVEVVQPAVSTTVAFGVDPRGLYVVHGAGLWAVQGVESSGVGLRRLFTEGATLWVGLRAWRDGCNRGQIRKVG